MNAIRVLAALALKLLLDLPIMLLGLVVVPLALRYEQDNHLPWWAEWAWGNKDHGNDGESFWAKRTVGWSRFRRCFVWLVLRNPSFNWSKYVLGINARPYVHVGDLGIGDKKKGGSYWNYAGLFFEFYSIRPYTLFGSRRCVRIRLGWKLENKQNEVCQFCFVVNPVMTYSGQ
jgi:hypothetical protein